MASDRSEACSQRLPTTDVLSTVKTIRHTVDCSAYEGTNAFRVIAFEVDPSDDDTDLVRQAQRSAEEQGGTDLDPGGRRRSRDELVKTRYLGALSELILEHYLQTRLGQEYRVLREDFHDYASHVDLKVIRGSNEVGLEVRGSFPYMPLERVICKLFDVIGPYGASYKPGETAKDIYIRTLINEDVKAFSSTRSHTLWFVGGAEKGLFARIGRDSNLKQRGASYRLIKPISVARDVPGVLHQIRGACG